ncbi:MAG: PD40 domain-containing protein [Candidatus Zixiibacteriota bacterium]|nr:MAG: PD40 domain-containing protein [candidate division Zixibacteria bacterium]
MRQLVSATFMLLAVGFAICAAEARGIGEEQSKVGYYRYPAIHGEIIVFVAEGDLWKVAVGGGVARRLTTHPGLESHASVSPDGRLVAYAAHYEGPTETYVIPLSGGLPTRLTYHGRRARPVGWTPDGKVLCATQHYSTLPSTQLVAIDPATVMEERVPLSQAAEGVYDGSGGTLFFTRFAKQGSYTKRYKGGTAQNIWKYRSGGPEAQPLTADYAGTSRWPMWHDGRVYFVSDRDGTMNIWSMDENGQDLKQETFHAGWDVKSPSMSGGRIAYQLGADLRLLDIAAGSDELISITLASDFDQMRENWVERPLDFLTSAHISPDGDRVVLTARGDLFVVPSERGRTIEVTRDRVVRYRDGRFMPDGKSLLALSDATGELEFCQVPADGLEKPRQLTSGGKVFRFGGLPSPDGKMIAYDDKDQKLWLFDLDSEITYLVDSSEEWGFSDLAWSPDSRWLAYVDKAPNFLEQVFIYDTQDRISRPVTSDRYRDRSIAWSPDGKWLYFLSDRDMSKVVPGVWTLQQPFPFVDEMTKIYLIPLVKGLKSPFEPDNELTAGRSEKKDDDNSDSTVTVDIDFDGIRQRIMEAPVPSGNYSALSAAKKQLLWLSWEYGSSGGSKLQSVEIKDKDVKVETLVDKVDSYELSDDGKKMLVRKERSLYVLDVSTSAPSDLNKSKVDLSDWSFSIDPVSEWRQILVDAWRLQRDHFYDPGMHQADWKAVLDKYLPLVDRVSDRNELSDLIGEMVGELSALHSYIRGGDIRKGPDNVHTASLGARLIRDERAGGYRVDHIYRSDPDNPEQLSPLAKPGVNIKEGDIIEEVNGQPVLSVPRVEALLRKQAGNQVLLTVTPVSSSETKKVIVEPITAGQAYDLRYREWEYSRRLIVEEEGDSEIGYIHLRATGTGDYSQWVREFFPIFNRKGLILDLRHNNGGNIDPWILISLLRKPWGWWQSRVGTPYSIMHQAFGGHLVVLCNEWTASDGELLAEGVRRLGLGKIIGTRTWGGEIWLSTRPWLVDRGVASIGESGVYGPEGKWLIEGHGVDPDMVVDNLPHETFNGKDTQLEAAIEYLKEQIRLNPVEVPTPPPYPDKSYKPGE